VRSEQQNLAEKELLPSASRNFGMPSFSLFAIIGGGDTICQQTIRDPAREGARLQLERDGRALQAR
jgi:hypothetical protein